MSDAASEALALVLTEMREIRKTEARREKEADFWRNKLAALTESEPLYPSWDDDSNDNSNNEAAPDGTERNQL